MAGSDGALRAVLERSRALGFLGPGPVEGQIDHALGFATAFERAPASFVDLGTGGGVPGLVLAQLWRRSTVVLLDSNERRTAFLTEAVEELGLGARVGVARVRAEEAGREARWRGRFAAVVARSFGPPAVTAECAAPLLAAGGVLVVSEPPEGEGRWPADGLALLGMRPGPVVGSDARFQVVVQDRPCPTGYPRRVGVPGKRPLWRVSRET